MKKLAFLVLMLLSFCGTYSQELANHFFPRQTAVVTKLPARKNVWVFVMAGQSNMAGRGIVEPHDTVPDPRIFTINQKNEILVAKEPLHYYEPTRTGLDCGLSFAKALLKSVPANVSILMVPTAVGGSSIQQWLGDSTYRNVKLLSNAREKISVARKVGTMKGILWHQGETNAMTNRDIIGHSGNLKALAKIFRDMAGNDNLPFLVAELGSFSKYAEAFVRINEQLTAYVKADSFSAFIKTNDLHHKGDSLHFDSQGQRLMGERFANEYLLIKVLTRGYLKN